MHISAEEFKALTPQQRKNYGRLSYCTCPKCNKTKRMTLFCDIEEGTFSEVCNLCTKKERKERELLGIIMNVLDNVGIDELITSPTKEPADSSTSSGISDEVHENSKKTTESVNIQSLMNTNMELTETSPNEITNSSEDFKDHPKEE